MNGAGNDFVVLDNRFLRFSEAELEALAAGRAPAAPASAPTACWRSTTPASGATSGCATATPTARSRRCAATAPAASPGSPPGPASAKPWRAASALSFDTDGGRYRALVA